MNRENLITMIQNASKNGFGDWQHEWAIKLYIYPLCSALITDEEMEKFTTNDGSVIDGKANVDKLLNLLGNRLEELVYGLNLSKQYYLDVNAYGLIYKEKGKIKNATFNFNIYSSPDKRSWDVYQWKKYKLAD